LQPHDQPPRRPLLHPRRNGGRFRQALAAEEGEGAGPQEMNMRRWNSETRPPPPWWGRASPLSELASLEAKGEGDTLSANTPIRCRETAAVTPSPRFSKLATLAKRNGP